MCQIESQKGGAHLAKVLIISQCTNWLILTIILMFVLTTIKKFPNIEFEFKFIRYCYQRKLTFMEKNSNINLIKCLFIYLILYGLYIYI